ncbi:hypothetical protein [Saltatorellus ferox]|uniref:hypothetical protein n=1 Tax=Saltatorellus ferox TaxID=2528018 RepID=UPI003AF35F47
MVFAHPGGRTETGDPASYPSRSELEGHVTGSSPLPTGWVVGSSSDVDTVETSSTTEYEAHIGDLAPSVYADWNYTACSVSAAP